MNTPVLVPLSLDPYIPEVPANDSLWLDAILTAAWQNRRLTDPQIRSQLRNKLPRNYSPKTIDRRLIQSFDVEITPLGVIALTGSEDILEKGDRIVTAIQDVLLDHPGIQRVDTTEIAGRTGLPLNEIGLMTHFLYSYGRPFLGYGSSTPDYYGAEFITFDPHNNSTIMQFRGMKEELIVQLEKEKVRKKEENEEMVGASTATQVLLIHFLLSGYGVNSVDHKMEVAEMVQFLNSRELRAKRLQDTNIYQRVGQPLKWNEKSLLRDLQAIRRYFINLHLDPVVALVDQEIKSCQQALKKK